MKKLSFLLLVGALTLAPVCASGMIARGGVEQKQGEEHGNKKFDSAKATEIRTEKEQIETAKETALQGLGNPNIDNSELVEEGTTPILEEVVDFKTSGDVLNASPSQEKLGSEVDEKNNEENIFDFATLEQRIEGAQKVIEELSSKGPTMEEATLKRLLKKWSKRCKRYQKAAEGFQQQNNSAQVEERLNKLVEISNKAVEELKKALENLSNNQFVGARQSTLGNSSKQPDPLMLEYEALREAANEAKTAFEFLKQFQNAEGDLLIDRSAKDNPRSETLVQLKTYKEKLEQWSSKIQGSTKASDLEEMAKLLTYQIIEDLDFKTPEHGAVFWTGYDKKNIRNQDTAKAYAEWAELRNKKTIEMTHHGKLLDQLGMYEADSPIAENGKSELANTLFEAASKKFAQAAHGNVTAFIYKPKDADQVLAFNRSTYHRIERPLLSSNQKKNLVQLKELLVTPEATLPLLEKIDENQKKLESLQKELNSVNTTKQAEEEKRKKLQKGLQKLQIEKNELEEKLEKKHKELQEKNATLQEIVKELNSLHETLKRTAKEIEHKQQELDKQTKKVSELNQKQEGLESQLKELQEKNNSLIAQNELTNNSKKETEGLLEKGKQELTKSGQEKQELERELNDLKNELNKEKCLNKLRELEQKARSSSVSAEMSFNQAELSKSQENIWNLAKFQVKEARDFWDQYKESTEKLLADFRSLLSEEDKSLLNDKIKEAHTLIEVYSQRYQTARKFLAILDLKKEWNSISEIITQFKQKSHFEKTAWPDGYYKYTGPFNKPGFSEYTKAAYRTLTIARGQDEAAATNSAANEMKKTPHRNKQEAELYKELSGGGSSEMSFYSAWHLAAELSTATELVAEFIKKDPSLKKGPFFIDWINQVVQETDELRKKTVEACKSKVKELRGDWFDWS